jgi:hypothetical protein
MLAFDQLAFWLFVFFGFLPKVKLRVKSCHVGGVVFFQSASLAQQKAPTDESHYPGRKESH